MVSQKRGHADAEGSDSEKSYDEVDISLSLARKRPRVELADAEADDSDNDLKLMLQNSITKRNVKGGAQLVKKVKGKKISKGEVGGGSFQSMGLHPSLLRSLTLQGYRIPTPIQRLAIPALLSAPPRDLVGMARTGSGKSLAFLIPLIQRLGGIHSTTFGARALILLPTRELALQILKVGKELVRGWHAGAGAHAGDTNSQDSAKGQNLKWSLIVGGEGLDEQFETISNNPDIIIATPGRLLHVLVEMSLDLKSVQYVVFDEADRLFEMGFETALNEILQRLSPARQTLLFSATLPKSLVEFAKAGLSDPKLVRLDAESKISPDLKMAFFSIKPLEKDACLLHLLRDVIRVPLGNASESNTSEAPAKGKTKHREQVTAPHQTLIFAATKHHVEYLLNLLTTAGYAVSHIYGSLDQTARSYQMDQFRNGHTSILVVTDVAARGIDIPVLENVVNFDFPQGSRVFVHRVGRVARAGRPGWAWSFVAHTELPYLLDLQLFLSRPLQCHVTGAGEHEYTENLILGPFDREKIDEEMEYVRQLEDVNHSLPSLRVVMNRGHAMYLRSMGKASPPSYDRAKAMIKDPKLTLAGSSNGIHPVLLRGHAPQKKSQETERLALLRTVNTFKPAETVFEVGSKGKANTANSLLMKDRRKALDKCNQRRIVPMAVIEDDATEAKDPRTLVEQANEEDIVTVFNLTKKQSNRDPEFYMSHYQNEADASEKGYSLRDGASFIEQARSATFDLAGDEGLARKSRQLNWDKKKKRFIKGDGVGADNVKLIRTENGAKLPATYRSGRFDEWKAKSRTTLPRIGDAEGEGTSSNATLQHRGKRYRHTKIATAKPLDRLSTDYDRKMRQAKKKEDSTAMTPTASTGKGGKPRTSRYGGKPIGKVKTELKNADQIRKSRKLSENRRAKNGRTNHHQKQKRK